MLRITLKGHVLRSIELLDGIEPAELYETGLTVMMRIVFLLSAEERGLLFMGDDRYQSNYAVSTLRMQLRGESEEILERRWDAWSRLLSIFRAVYDGGDHSIFLGSVLDVGRAEVGDALLFFNGTYHRFEPRPPGN